VNEGHISSVSDLTKHIKLMSKYNFSIWSLERSVAFPRRMIYFAVPYLEFPLQVRVLLTESSDN
jgi:hypothetical protein